MKTFGLRSKGRLFRGTFLVLVAALSLAGSKAAQAVDFNVTVDPASPNDHTVRIQDALNNSAYDRVILPYRSAGWISNELFMNTANQELWIKGSGSTPGKLVAKTGAFTGTTDRLIRILKPGCTVNGYSDGVNVSSGRATLEMHKATYMANPGTYPVGEGRHAIMYSYDTTTIKGVNIKNAGGDGIYTNGGTGCLIKDVIVDNAYRNAITVISSTDLTIDDCTLKNTSGHSPEAGIDFEPNNNTEVFDNIVISDVIFQNNAGKNIQIGVGKLTGVSLTPLNIRFYRCTSQGAPYGIFVAYCYASGPTGTVYFQDTEITGSSSYAIRVSEWNADRAKITFNDMLISHCADSSSSPPIHLNDGTLGPNGEAGPTATTPGEPGFGPNSVGEIKFQGECYIDDYNTAHTELLRGQHYNGSTVFKDITGNIYYRKAYSGTNLVTWTGGTQSGNTLTFTPY
jgi:hypothetical protein